MSWNYCHALVDGVTCGKEECSTVHMTVDGHDFKETPDED